MTFSRQTIAARIRALLAKTTAAGATEAEAAMAAEKARDLLDKYAIDLGEVGLEIEGTCKADTTRRKAGRVDLTSRLAARIAQFTDCRVWQSAGVVTYFGLKADTDFAVWLTSALEGFVEQAAAEYMAGQRTLYRPKDRYEAKKAFILGCVTRINTRLGTLTAERQAAMRHTASTTGKSLVIVKSAIVNRDFAKLGLRLRSGGRRQGAAIRDGGAYGAGQAAGERASFGRPLGGGAGGLALGYRGRS